MSFASSLKRFFPPPAYLQLHSVGVDISDTSLKYVQFRPNRRSGGDLSLQYSGDIDIPKGVLERGTINDRAKLVAAIKEVRKRTGTRYVRVSLPEEHAYIFETEIKKDTELKEIRGLLEFKMQDDVPLSPQDAFFDYDISESARDKSMLQVTVTACAKEVVMSYYQACREAGVVPLSFEVESQAITRSVIPAGDTKTHMIVDLGQTRTGIGIVHDGVLMYTSTIDIGGENLSKALRVVLGDKPEHELTEIKNKHGLIPGASETVVYDALKPVMENIVKEVNRRIQYWNNKGENLADRQIESVTLVGGSANLKGLVDYFSRELDIKVSLANVWRNAFSLDEEIPAIDKRHSYGYATAIGLALSSFNKK